MENEISFALEICFFLDIKAGNGRKIMGNYYLEVVVLQIQQTTTNKVVDKQPAAVHWLSTTSLVRVIDW